MARFPIKIVSGHADVIGMTDLISSGTRTAWDVIESTCDARLTGELKITTSTATTNIYMTRGLIYLAERDTDAPLAERIGARAADGGQLEHSEGAEEAIQLATEKMLLDIADDMVQSFETTMYLHHPSGIDRWFSSQRPRQAAEVRTCSSLADDVGPLLRIEPTPAPSHLIPAADAVPVPEDVAAAVRRAITAIEEATRGVVPRRTA